MPCVFSRHKDCDSHRVLRQANDRRSSALLPDNGTNICITVWEITQPQRWLSLTHSTSADGRNALFNAAHDPEVPPSVYIVHAKIQG
jgi:hypothetical protein